MLIYSNLCDYRKGREVAVVYFRDGYSPEHYNSEQVI